MVGAATLTKEKITEQGREKKGKLDDSNFAIG